MILIVSLLRIAIWDRDIVVSLISIGVWAGGFAVIIRGTPFLRLSLALSSHFPFPSSQRLGAGAKFSTEVPISETLYSCAQLEQVEVTIDPLVNTCVIAKIHKNLANVLAVLVVDTVHLLAMLIGLLRHPSRRSTGLWKLLYQQVRSDPFSSLASAESLLVYDLDGLGGVCRDTTCGQSVSTILVVSSSTFRRSYFF